MSHHVRGIQLSKRELAFLIVVLFGALYIFGMGAARNPVSSSELRFSEPSKAGLAIVPASCPSNPHYAGECSSTCTAGYICIGNDRYYRNASCQESFVQNCPQGCANGVCLDNEGLETVAFQATDINGKTFLATGALQVRASLVRTGEPTRVYWNVVNAQSCTVTAPNGDSWTGSFSGVQGKTTRFITQQTTYTLTCTALPGVQPSTLVDTDTVNVIPVFQAP